MTDVLERTGAAGGLGPRLRVRGPAYGVITECLRIQASARRQSRLARLFGVSPLQPDARGWYRGALGEIRAVKALKGLGPQFTLLHAGPDGGVDHLVIGPTGVFTVSRGYSCLAPPQLRGRRDDGRHPHHRHRRPRFTFLRPAASTGCACARLWAVGSHDHARHGSVGGCHDHPVARDRLLVGAGLVQLAVLAAVVVQRPL